MPARRAAAVLLCAAVAAIHLSATAGQSVTVSEVLVQPRIRDGDYESYATYSLDGNNFVVPNNVSYYDVFRADFSISFSVASTLAGASAMKSRAPLVINAVPTTDTGVIGMSVGEGPSVDSVLVRIGDGTRVAEEVFSHDSIADGVRAAYTIQVHKNSTGRTVSVFLNNDFLAARLFPIDGDIYSGGGVTFGEANGWTFKGTLLYLTFAKVLACDRQPCGMGSICTDTTTAPFYSCACDSGYVEDPTTGDCTRVPYSCKACDELGTPVNGAWFYGGNSTTICSSPVTSGCARTGTYAAAETRCSALGARVCTASEVAMGELFNFPPQAPLCGSAQRGNIRVWTQDLCTTSTGASGRYTLPENPGLLASMPKQCTADTTTTPFVRCCADADQVHASRYSCAELGWPTNQANVVAGREDICGVSLIKVVKDTSGAYIPEAGPGNCFAAETWWDAEVICIAAGGRLCSLGEVESDETSNTGCSFNTNRIWTSGACNATHAWSVAGASGARGALPRLCIPKTTKTSVRCCGDVNLPARARSAASCASKGWPVTSQTGAQFTSSAQVCGYSFCLNRDTRDQRTFANAQRVCTNQGARLCTLAEVIGQETAGSGCGFDRELVWTNDTCRTCAADGSVSFGHIVSRGSTQFTTADNDQRQCVADGTRAYVRCCADVQPECSAAGTGDGDCGKIYRRTCTTRNLCGNCLPGLTGEAGPSNAPDCQDTTPPTITNCPGPVVTGVGTTSLFEGNVTWTPPTATDNFQLKSLTSTHQPGSLFPYGNTTVVYTATDAFGLTTTCSFRVEVTVPVRLSYNRAFGQTINKQNVVFKDLPFFADMLKDSFTFTLSTTPTMAGSFISQAPFYINSNPLSSADVGLSIGYRESNTFLEVRVADGSRFGSAVFDHPELPLDTRAVRRVQVTSVPGGRNITLFINNAKINTINVPVPGAIYNGAGMLFGDVNFWRFVGSLGSVSFTEQSPCDAMPCGASATCAETSATTYACTCRPGFTGTADASGNGCTPVTPSCKSCSVLGWAGLGSPDVCAESEVTGVCPPASNFSVAETTCKSVGARLCTDSEVANEETARTGCFFDNQRIWTADMCTTDTGFPGHITRGGASTSSLGPVCTDDTTNTAIYTRCCADEERLQTSPVSCDVLGWKNDFGSPSVCGRSRLSFNEAGVRVGGSAGACFLGKTFEEAELICGNNGGRLCTISEILAGDSRGDNNEDTSPYSFGPCGYNLKQIWASGQCPSDSDAWAVLGGGTEIQALPTSPDIDPTCVPRSNLAGNVAVRCCADAVVPPTPVSAQSCASLPSGSWKVVSGASVVARKVCGHSFLNCTFSSPIDPAERMTWANAKSYCQSVGGRMCSAYEITAGAGMDTGCGYNGVRIWSADACKNCKVPNGHVSLGGTLTNILSTNPRQCDGDTAVNYVRCCADVIGDCSDAGVGGDCNILNRAPCSTVPNTCGPCLPTFEQPADDPNNKTICADKTPPVIKSCPADITVAANVSGVNTTVTWQTPVATDNDRVVTLVAWPPAGSGFPPGKITNVTYTATDRAGNTATCTFSVKVLAQPANFDDTIVRNVRDNTVNYPDKPAFALLYASNFRVQIVAEALRIDGQRSFVPFVINKSPNVDVDVGMSIGVGKSVDTLEVRIADGTMLRTATFTHPALGTSMRNVHEVTVRRTATGRTVSVSVNGNPAAIIASGNSTTAVFSGLKGDIYTGQGFRFGNADSWTFSGTLYSVSVRRLTACDGNNVCGARADCVPNRLNFDLYSCVCKPGYSGTATDAGQGCTPEKRSCQSCAQLGWATLEAGTSSVCAQVVTDSAGVCPPPMAYADAATYCTNAGARLCTVSELSANEASAITCDAQAQRVWAVDPCGPAGAGTFSSQAASADFLSSVPAQCSTNTTQLGVVCCADTDPRLTSERSCADFGWPSFTGGARDIPNVCGDSELQYRLDGVKNPNPPPSGFCISSVNWYDAERACYINGARMCSLEELNAGESQGTGCGYDALYIWSSTECSNDSTKAYAQLGSAGFAGSMPEPKCLPKTTSSSRYNLAVRCCADRDPPPRVGSASTCSQLPGWTLNAGLGSVCAISNPKCLDKRTFQEPPSPEEFMSKATAETNCKALGGRLCTYGELAAESSKGTGCGYDRLKVWSSTPCSNCSVTGFLAVAGNRDFYDEAGERECLPASAKAVMRCCADASIDCSRAPDCVALNREPCSTSPNTCGACIPALDPKDGVKGPSNADTCVDLRPPTITCPMDMVLEIAADQLSSEATWPLPVASDNIGVTSVETTPASGSTLNFGPTLVIGQAFDAAGNRAKCNFTVRLVHPSQCPKGFSDVSYNGTCSKCGPGTFEMQGSRGPCSQFVCPLGKADTDSDPSTPCVSCGPSQFQDQTGQTTCKNFRTCPAGQAFVPPTTAVADRTCTPCSSGTFKASAGNVNCISWSACGVGQEQDAAPTTTSDRTCKNCVAGTTFNPSAGATTNTSCQTVTPSCNPGQFLQTAATISSDNVCKPCPTGQYQDTAGLSASCKTCTTTCPAGQYLLPCTATSNGQCLSCPAGTFSAGSNADTACLPIKTVCDGDKYISTMGSATAQTVCSPCSSCTKGTQFVAMGCNGINNTMCADCITSCPDGQYKDGTCSDNTLTVGPVCRPCDPSCATCSASGSNKCLKCPGAFVLESNGTCSSTCKDGEYPAANSGGSPTCMSCDTSCARCKGPGASDCIGCPPGMFLDGGSCVSTCSTGTFGAADQTCQPCTVCSTNQYQSSSCSPTADAVCFGINTCTVGLQYVTVAATATSDVECGTCAGCPAGTKIQAGSCDGVSNTVCLPCDPAKGEYQDSSNQGSCKVASTCTAPGYYVARVLTATADLSCLPCPAGTTDHDRNASTPCMTCPAGSYVPPGSSGPCSTYSCREGTVDVDGDPSTPCADCQPNPASCPQCAVSQIGFQNERGQTSCKLLSVCQAGTYQLVPPSPFFDRVCTTCPPGSFTTAQNTASACVPATPCQSGEWEALPPTTTSDRQCLTATICNTGAGGDEYTQVPSTSTSNAICSKLTTCVFNSTYQTVAPSLSNDRVCSPVTPPCRYTQAAAPTLTSDRICQGSFVMLFRTNYDTVFPVASDVQRFKQTIVDLLVGRLTVIGFANPRDVLTSDGTTITISRGSVLVNITSTSETLVTNVAREVDSSSNPFSFDFRPTGSATILPLRAEDYNNPPQPSSGGSSSSTAAIVAVVAVLVVIVLVVVVIVMYRKSKKASTYDSQNKTFEDLRTKSNTVAFANPSFSSLEGDDNNRSNPLFGTLDEEDDMGNYSDLPGGVSDGAAYFDPSAERPGASGAYLDTAPMPGALPGGVDDGGNGYMDVQAESGNSEGKGYGFDDGQDGYMDVDA